MLITNKLASYKSKEQCNLEMFKLEPYGHSTKYWISKDGTKHLIRKMETMHLWHTYNMLKSDLDTEITMNAIQYIGHELYKRGMMVKSLPPKNYTKKINRADNLHRGFRDSKEKCICFDDEEDGPGEIGWNGGEFYKE